MDDILMNNLDDSDDQHQHYILLCSYFPTLTKPLSE